MPKSKHRKKPLPSMFRPPHLSPLDPDFGEFMWENGYAGKPLVLISALPRGYLDYGSSADLGFIFHTPGGKFMGTLNTPQSADALGIFLDGRTPVRIDAKLDDKLVRGKGGEWYRLFLGTISPLDPTDVPGIEPTIGRVHPDRVKGAEKMAAECRNSVTHEPITVLTGFNPPIDPAVIEFLSFFPEPADGGKVNPDRLERPTAATGGVGRD
jgi:hypothetical protein